MVNSLAKTAGTETRNSHNYTKLTLQPDKQVGFHQFQACILGSIFA